MNVKCRPESKSKNRDLPQVPAWLCSCWGAKVSLKSNQTEYFLLFYIASPNKTESVQGMTKLTGVTRQIFPLDRIRGDGARTVEHEKLKISRFGEPVSQ